MPVITLDVLPVFFNLTFVTITRSEVLLIPISQRGKPKLRGLVSPRASKGQSFSLRGLTLEGDQLCEAPVTFNSLRCFSKLVN